ncbi:MAG: hypothetical protein LKJ37_05460 [Ligilactobacillus acidipiscis]|jgi:hypothetical protein|nr:hypothetical protein [Ligilactobacillus acidipiscis]MCI1954408.1 hypothetical protein [Ligilactobacillus acidipiscis]
MLTNSQIKKFFVDKENAPCPITNRLIENGYRQKSGGYISYAKQLGVKKPTQYWHLMESWSRRSADDAKFTRAIQCGELIFWMAEVSEAVDQDTMNRLADLIIDQYVNDRHVGNRIIQETCFSKIETKVGNNC